MAGRSHLTRVAAALGLSLLLVGCGYVNGEDPSELVSALRTSPAFKVSPPGASPKGEVDAGADSGSAYAQQAFEGCGPRPAVIDFYAATLDDLGWRYEPGPGFWLGTVKGKRAELYLPSGDVPPDCSIEIFVEYDTGLLGG